MFFYCTHNCKKLYCITQNILVESSTVTDMSDKSMIKCNKLLFCICKNICLNWKLK